jgi:hypothetical protein
MGKLRHGSYPPLFWVNPLPDFCGATLFQPPGCEEVPEVSVGRTSSGAGGVSNPEMFMVGKSWKEPAGNGRLSDVGMRLAMSVTRQEEGRGWMAME